MTVGNVNVLNVINSKKVLSQKYWYWYRQYFSPKYCYWYWQ